MGRDAPSQGRRPLNVNKPANRGGYFSQHGAAISQQFCPVVQQLLSQHGELLVQQSDPGLQHVSVTQHGAAGQQSAPLPQQPCDAV
jgi:hypothetical protein